MLLRPLLWWFEWSFLSRYFRRPIFGALDKKMGRIGLGPDAQKPPLPDDLFAERNTHGRL